MACITFVIIGIVLALRFPRGGIGLVIGGGPWSSPSIMWAHRGREPGRPGACRSLVRHVGAQYRADGPGSHLALLWVSRRIRVHPRRRLPGGDRGPGALQPPAAAEGAPVIRTLLTIRQCAAQTQSACGHGLRQLDRYVLSTWLRLFVLAALGLPLVAIFFNLTDMLSKLLDRGLTMREIADQLRVCPPRVRFPGHAGRGAPGHRVHRRRHGPALRADCRQGRRAELSPPHAAPVHCGRAGRGSGLRRG